MKTPFEKRQILQNKGLIFVYNKQENGMYKIDVWDNEVFFKTSKKEFVCMFDAMNDAVNIFYSKYFSK